MPKTKSDILDDLKLERLKLDQAVACQQLVGTEGYRVLMAAVAEEIRGYGKRLMQMDCAHEETNQLRAKITSLNWFMRWSVKGAEQIAVLVKRMEGLQKLAQQRHDPGSSDHASEIDKLVAEVQKFKADMVPQEST